MHEQDITRHQNQTMEPSVMIRSTGLSLEARNLFDAIARRAYQIFESKGRPFGRDLENWLQAESELFERTPLRLTESKDELSVFAEVYNYEPKELEVDLEPRRVTIIGKHQGEGARKPDGGVSTQKSALLLSLQLPVEIDPQHATARLKRGVLELDIKKAPPNLASTRRPAAKANAA